jgi:hypothetical protein
MAIDGPRGAAFVKNAANRLLAPLAIYSTSDHQRCALLVRPQTKQFWIASACACVLLSGCASPQMLAARDEQLCRSVGAGPDTSDYAECRAIIAAHRDAKQAAALNALMGIGLAAMAQQPAPPVVPRSIDCTVEPNGPRVRSVSCW